MAVPVSLLSLRQGDLVWGKLGRYPPWPGKIVPPPKDLKKPLGKKCLFVKFFGTEDHAWIRVDQLKPYHAHKEEMIKAAKGKRFQQAVTAVDEFLKKAKARELAKEQSSEEKKRRNSSEEKSKKTVEKRKLNGKAKKASGDVKKGMPSSHVKKRLTSDLKKKILAREIKKKVLAKEMKKILSSGIKKKSLSANGKKKILTSDGKKKIGKKFVNTNGKQKIVAKKILIADGRKILAKKILTADTKKKTLSTGGKKVLAADRKKRVLLAVSKKKKIVPANGKKKILLVAGKKKILSGNQKKKILSVNGKKSLSGDGKKKILSDDGKKKIIIFSSKRGSKSLLKGLEKQSSRKRGRPPKDDKDPNVPESSTMKRMVMSNLSSFKWQSAFSEPVKDDPHFHHFLLSQTERPVSYQTISKRLKLSDEEMRSTSIQAADSTAANGSINPTDKRIGFLGLGLMGSGIVSNLLKMGHSVTVWNRTADKCDLFLEEGARLGRTPAEVVSTCDITFSCVADPQAARDLVLGPSGVLQGIRPGKCYVDLSTVDPETVVEVSRVIVSRGGRFLEAPVSGNQQLSNEGMLVILAAGDQGVYEDCSSCFQAIGKASFFLGEVGNAAKMMLILSMVQGSFMATIAEGLTLAQVTGQSQQTLLDILNQGQLASNFLDQKCQNILQGNFKPDSYLKYIQKDLRLAIALGDSVNLPTPMAAAANEVANLPHLLYSGACMSQRLFSSERFVVGQGEEEACEREGVEVEICKKKPREEGTHKRKRSEEGTCKRKMREKVAFDWECENVGISTLRWTVDHSDRVGTEQQKHKKKNCSLEEKTGNVGMAEKEPFNEILADREKKGVMCRSKVTCEKLCDRSMAEEIKVREQVKELEIKKLAEKFCESEKRVCEMVQVCSGDKVQTIEEKRKMEQMPEEICDREHEFAEICNRKLRREEACDSNLRQNEICDAEQQLVCDVEPQCRDIYYGEKKPETCVKENRQISEREHWEATVIGVQREKSSDRVHEQGTFHYKHKLNTFVKERHITREWGQRAFCEAGHRQEVLEVGHRQEEVQAGHRQDVLETGQRQEVHEIRQQKEICEIGQLQVVCEIGQWQEVHEIGQHQDVQDIGQRQEVWQRQERVCEVQQMPGSSATEQGHEPCVVILKQKIHLREHKQENRAPTQTCESLSKQEITKGKQRLGAHESYIRQEAWEKKPKLNYQSGLMYDAGGNEPQYKTCDNKPGHKICDVEYRKDANEEELRHTTCEKTHDKEQRQDTCEGNSRKAIDERESHQVTHEWRLRQEANERESRQETHGTELRHENPEWEQWQETYQPVLRKEVCKPKPRLEAHEWTPKQHACEWDLGQEALKGKLDHEAHQSGQRQEIHESEKTKWIGEMDQMPETHERESRKEDTSEKKKSIGTFARHQIKETCEAERRKNYKKMQRKETTSEDMQTFVKETTCKKEQRMATFENKHSKETCDWKWQKLESNEREEEMETTCEKGHRKVASGTEQRKGILERIDGERSRDLQREEEAPYLRELRKDACVLKCHTATEGEQMPFEIIQRKETTCKLEQLKDICEQNVKHKHECRKEKETLATEEVYERQPEGTVNLRNKETIRTLTIGHRGEGTVCRRIQGEGKKDYAVPCEGESFVLGNPKEVICEIKWREGEDINARKPGDEEIACQYERRYKNEKIEPSEGDRTDGRTSKEHNYEMVNVEPNKQGIIQIENNCLVVQVETETCQMANMEEETSQMAHAQETFKIRQTAETGHLFGLVDEYCQIVQVSEDGGLAQIDDTCCHEAHITTCHISDAETEEISQEEADKMQLKAALQPRVDAQSEMVLQVEAPPDKGQVEGKSDGVLQVGALIEKERQMLPANAQISRLPQTEAKNGRVMQIEAQTLMVMPVTEQTARLLRINAKIDSVSKGEALTGRGLHIDEQICSGLQFEAQTGRELQLKGLIGGLPQIERQNTIKPQVQGHTFRVPQVEAQTVRMSQVEVQLVSGPQVEAQTMRRPPVKGQTIKGLQAVGQIEGQAVRVPQVEGQTVRVPQVEGQTVRVPQVEGPTVRWPQVEGQTVRVLQVEEQTVGVSQVEGQTVRVPQVGVGSGANMVIEFHPGANSELQVEAEVRRLAAKHDKDQISRIAEEYWQMARAAQGTSLPRTDETVHDVAHVDLETCVQVDVEAGTQVQFGSVIHLENTCQLARIDDKYLQIRQVSQDTFQLPLSEAMTDKMVHSETELDRIEHVESKTNELEQVEVKYEMRPLKADSYPMIQVGIASHVLQVDMFPVVNLEEEPCQMVEHDIFQMTEVPEEACQMPPMEEMETCHIIKVEGNCQVVQIEESSGQLVQIEEQEVDSCEIIHVEGAASGAIHVTEDACHIIEIEHEVSELLHEEDDSCQVIEIEDESSEFNAEAANCQIIQIENDISDVHVAETCQIMQMGHDAGELIHVDGETGHILQVKTTQAFEIVHHEKRKTAEIIHMEDDLCNMTQVTIPLLVPQVEGLTYQMSQMEQVPCQMSPIKDAPYQISHVHVVPYQMSGLVDVPFRITGVEEVPCNVSGVEYASCHVAGVEDVLSQMARVKDVPCLVSPAEEFSYQSAQDLSDRIGRVEQLPFNMAPIENVHYHMTPLQELPYHISQLEDLPHRITRVGDLPYHMAQKEDTSCHMAQIEGVCCQMTQVDELSSHAAQVEAVHQLAQVEESLCQISKVDDESCKMAQVEEQCCQMVQVVMRETYEIVQVDDEDGSELIQVAERACEIEQIDEMQHHTK